MVNQKLKISIIYIYIYINIVFQASDHQDFMQSYLYYSNTLAVVALSRDGNGAGQVRKMGFSPPPRIVLFYSILASPYIKGKIFLPHPHPLGHRESPPYPVKLYFLLIYL